MESNLHAGHRERMRARWRKGTYLEEHELIEMLLYYSIPRRNTNELAHILNKKFGSLRGLLRADKKALREIEGIGENSVLFFELLTEAVSRYLVGEMQTDRLLTDTEVLCAYLNTLYIGVPEERVYLLLFCSNGRLLRTEQVASGFAMMSEISMQKIHKLAVQHNATFAILAHNHPNGVPYASDKDRQTTKRLRESLALLGVELVDHWIVAHEQCVSVWSECQGALYS